MPNLEHAAVTTWQDGTWRAVLPGGAWVTLDVLNKDGLARLGKAIRGGSLREALQVLNLRG